MALYIALPWPVAMEEKDADYFRRERDRGVIKALAVRPTAPVLLGTGRRQSSLRGRAFAALKRRHGLRMIVRQMAGARFR